MPFALTEQNLSGLAHATMAQLCSAHHLPGCYRGSIQLINLPLNIYYILAIFEYKISN